MTQTARRASRVASFRRGTTESEHASAFMERPDPLTRSQHDDWRRLLARLRQVEERCDLCGLDSERDRKVDEPSHVERRSSEIKWPVSARLGIQVLPGTGAVVRQDDP